MEGEKQFLDTVPPTAAYLALGLAECSNRCVMGEDVERECAQR
jgi:hypothetical protein